VSGEYGTAERVDLDLADDGHPGALQAKLEAADPGEQGEDVHGRSPRRQVGQATTAYGWPPWVMPAAIPQPAARAIASMRRLLPSQYAPSGV
jgi:hypothetical protein